MIDLTVGHVSGIIAAGGYIAQFFIPTATTLILAGLLSDENTLMTWTQAARAFHSSYWPFLVRADFTVVGPVSRPVTVEAILRPLALVLVAVAGVVTPLGLYDTVIPEDEMTPTPFQYRQDPSGFGYGTAERTDTGFNRKCGARYPVECPSSNTVVVPISATEYYLPNGYNLTVPGNVTEMFQSGLEDLPSTVSSIFDIEYRSFAKEVESSEYIPPVYTVGTYRHIESLLLREGYHVIEGLIVNNEDIGVGFRRHTVPSTLEYGGSWSEDILFVEPHTECVNTNLTFDFRMSVNTSTISNLVLTDRGGFARLNQTYPYYNRTVPQENADLHGRAYKAAYLFNGYTMMYMNITNPETEELEEFSYLNSEVGDAFPVDVDFTLVSPSTPLLGSTWGIQTQLPPSIFSNKSEEVYTNPYNITNEDFLSRELLCKGAGDIDLANITNINVECSIILGTPQSTDGSTSPIIEPGTNWSVPIHSCASATRATIKTVDFRYNGTDGINSLIVDDIRDKQYTRDEDKPLWGVENTDFYLRDVRPLWGLVAESYRGREDLSVLQHESLWLPGFSAFQGPSYTTMNLPGAEFHTNAFRVAYGVNGLPGTIIDYTGKSNAAMYKKWVTYSANASTTGYIINSIWMDNVANSVIGTRGWTKPSNASGHEKRADLPTDSVDVPVNLYRHKVKYDMLYGIPACIVLAICLFIAVTAALLGIFGNAKPSVVRKHIFNTAVGRIMASINYPGQAHPHAETRFWNLTVGGKKVSMANKVPQPMEIVATPHYTQPPIGYMDAPLLQKSEMVSPGLRPPEGLRSRETLREREDP